MFQYKDITFYNDYCTNLEDFTLLEAFSREDNFFVGKIMPNKAIYPIEIYVHIPLTFPHNKLIFRTKSISGYPHLISYEDKQKFGSWFCLNTAFAETAEEQLNEEFDRLKEWISRQLRPELPRHIVDTDTVSALRMFNAYEGENPDELKEISSKSNFIFIGKFGKERQNFKDYGYLNAVRYPNNQFTIVKDEVSSNYKLPYVIVNHFPGNICSFATWVKDCKWNNDLCQLLLPGFKWGEDVLSAQLRGKLFELYIEDDEAKKRLPILRELAGKIDMPIAHKNALNKELDNFLENTRKNREYINRPMSEVEKEPDYEFLSNCYECNLHYFAIGLFYEGEIMWNLVCTNLDNGEKQTFYYDLDKYSFEVNTLVDIRLLSFSTAQFIEKESFFGRGKLHESICSKKIALVGLGAIGSSLAESLVRGGINNLSLWDGDVVEPGNICRSSYDQSNIGNSKVISLKEHLEKISPFVKIEQNGFWEDPTEYDTFTGIKKYRDGEFYGNINYDSQAKFISRLKGYDLIIDCTASNELLHFLSYAAADIAVLSLCITNQSKDLLCISNHTGNPFEQRKHYLASIEQETANFYSERTGCYSPTFLATYCDIQALTNLCVRTINKEFQQKEYIDSIMWHYSDNGIIANNIFVYQLENSRIRMTISNTIIENIKRLPMLKNGENGYLLGGYNTERTVIFVTNAISKINADIEMKNIKTVSKGIIDYIGNICISTDNINEIPQHCQDNIVRIAESEDVNTNNPIVAKIGADGNVQFSLYINKKFVPFHKL